MADRIFLRRVSDCSGCPARSMDRNLTRWQCSAERGRFIAWDHGDAPQPPPDWCPLPEITPAQEAFSQEALIDSACEAGWIDASPSSL